MASPKGKQLRNIEDIITCQICVGILRNPKILDCLHSFCEKCLISIQSRLSNISRSEFKFVCPVCEAITFKNGGVTKLRDDIKSQQIIAVMEEEATKECEGINQNSKPNCNICEAEAAFSCPDCELILCFSCKNEHEADLTESEGHSIMDLKLGVLCGSHPTRLKKFYCQKCETSLCKVCLHKHEKNHPRVSVQKYFEYHASLLEESKLLGAVSLKFKGDQEDYEAVYNIQEEITEETKTTLAKITAVAEAKIGAIKKTATTALEAGLIGNVPGVSDKSPLRNASEKIDLLIEDLKKAADGTLEDNLKQYSDLMKRSGEIKALSLKVDDLPKPGRVKETMTPAVMKIVEAFVEGMKNVLEDISADTILKDLGLRNNVPHEITD